MNPLPSILMYLYARHVVCCNANKRKIAKHDHSDLDAIEIVEALWILIQRIG